MKRYVVGFLFDGAGSVALIKKSKPAWQRGLLNGLGGHIEDGESPATAMSREFLEEGGVEIVPERWRYFALLKGHDKEGPVEVWCFTCTRTANLKQMTDEPVSWYNAFICFDPSVVPSLHWLVPMAMDPNSPQLVAVVDNVAR
jgi:8-oxo-dGTP diphosphatase